MNTGIPNQNQNLLKQVRPAPTAPRPHGAITLVVLEALAVILAGVFGRATAAYIGGSLSFGVAVAAALLFFAVSTFGAIFGTSTARRLIVIALETLAFAALFGIRELPFLLAAAIIIFIFSLWGDIALRRELENRLRMRFTAVARLKVAHLFTGFLLAGIILALPPLRGSAMPLSESRFSALFDSGVQVLGGTYGGVRLDGTVEDFAESVARKELAGEAEFNQLPPDAQAKAVRQAAAAEIAQAEKSLNLALAPDAKISHIFYSYIAAFIKDWQANLGNSFFVLWGIILFVFLRGIGFLVIWAALIIAVAMYQLAAAFGIISIVSEPATQERLILNK